MSRVLLTKYVGVKEVTDATGKSASWAREHLRYLAYTYCNRERGASHALLVPVEVWERHASGGFVCGYGSGETHGTHGIGKTALELVSPQSAQIRKPRKRSRSHGNETRVIRPTRAHGEPR